MGSSWDLKQRFGHTLLSQGNYIVLGQMEWMASYVPTRSQKRHVEYGLDKKTACQGSVI